MSIAQEHPLDFVRPLDHHLEALAGGQRELVVELEGQLPTMTNGAVTNGQPKALPCH